MYLLNLFRNWFSENVAEFDREGLSREVIAQKAFIAGFNAAQHRVQADDYWRCAKCQEYNPGNQGFCSGCGETRRR